MFYDVKIEDMNYRNYLSYERSTQASKKVHDLLDSHKISCGLESINLVDSAVDLAQSTQMKEPILVNQVEYKPRAESKISFHVPNKESELSE